MASGHRLQYLSGIRELELRAYEPNETYLLQIVGRGSTTICHRTAESQDLIITESSSGQVKFCIGGAEIPEHSVTVYYSPDQVIGTIENDLIEQSGVGSNYQIYRNARGYQIDGTNILMDAQFCRISYRENTSLELKSLILAFAIHQALFVSASMLESSMRVSGDIITTNPVSTSVPQCLPLANKPVSHTIFDQIDQSHVYHLLALGRTTHSLDFIIGLMDDSPRHNVLLCSTIHIRTRAMEIVDINGRNICTKRCESDEVFEVLSDSKSIGKVSDFHKDKTTYITVTEGTASIQLQIRMQKIGFKKRIKIVDSSEQVLMLIKCDTQNVMDVQIKSALSLIEKKVIFAFAFTYYCVVNSLVGQMPTMSLSILRCSCARCETPQGDAGNNDQRTFRLADLTKHNTLHIIAVGHNTAKNLVYYSVAAEKETTLLTLECIPLADLNGLVKLTAKTKTGKKIFHAVSFPADDMLAIYSVKGPLMTYETRGTIYEHDGRPILRMVALPRDPNFLLNWETARGRNIKYSLYKEDALVSTITQEGRVIFVNQETKKGEFFPSAMLISLAVKLFNDIYSEGSCHTPEISYRYAGATKDATPLLE